MPTLEISHYKKGGTESMANDSAHCSKSLGFMKWPHKFITKKIKLRYLKLIMRWRVPRRLSSLSLPESCYILYLVTRRRLCRLNGWSRLPDWTDVTHIEDNTLVAVKYDKFVTRRPYTSAVNNNECVAQVSYFAIRLSSEVFVQTNLPYIYIYS